MDRNKQERMSTALGWFSIGLGVAELLAPRALAKLIGVKDHRPLPALGMREIMSGIGLLTEPQSAGWMWSRVGGDAMDLTLLAKAMTDDENDRGKLVMATAAVVGVTALDVMNSLELTQVREDAEPGAIRVTRSVTIDRSPQELYDYWRDFEKLPTFMRHLESVTSGGDNVSHWVAKGPLGKTVEWDAEITHDEPGRSISWRSLDGATVPNVGTVEFRPASGNRGTIVQVRMEYQPPAGALGAGIARFLGEEPDLQITDDLRAFKQMMEIGEVVVSEGSVEGGHVIQQPARAPLAA